MHLGAGSRRWRAAVVAVGLTGAVGLAGALLAGCAGGPSQRPPVAVVDDRLVPPEPTTPPAESPPPAGEVPATDLDWSDCAARTRDAAGLTAPGPAGLVLECATLDVELDPAVSGRLELGLLRAKLPTTPADAPPVVLTTGVDEASTTALARLATTDGEALLAAAPVVALDRRGTGTSDALDCLSDRQRTALLDVDPADTAAVLETGRQATQDCTDVLTPAELALGADRAADDLEALRTRWGVSRLVLVGSGDGAQVALRYAVAHPDALARLVLDSPTDPVADAATASDSAAAGAETAFDAFAARCVAAGCPLGPDPRAAVTALLAAAGSGAGPVGPDGPLGAGEVLAVLRDGLRSGAPGLADALATAAGGDGTALAGLAAAGAGSAALDGRFAATCSDAALRPTPDAVAALVTEWAGTHPLFGADAAARLALCLSWPTPPTAPAVASLAALPPVLLLDGAADPLTGPQDAERTAAALTQAGASSATLGWQGVGHPVLTGSACARAAVTSYLAGGALPARDTVCPP